MPRVRSRSNRSAESIPCDLHIKPLREVTTIQYINVCTGCSDPRGAQARHVPAPCIAPTAPAVAPTADTHSSHTSAASSLGMKRGNAAESTPTPRSSTVEAADLSLPAPLHGTVPRWRSQRGHANRKRATQASHHRSSRQRLLRTVCMNACQHAHHHR